MIYITWQVCSLLQVLIPLLTYMSLIAFTFVIPTIFLLFLLQFLELNGPLRCFLSEHIVHIILRLLYGFKSVCLS